LKCNYWDRSGKLYPIIHIKHAIYKKMCVKGRVTRLYREEKEGNACIRQFDATRTTFTHKTNVIFWNPKGGTFLPKQGIWPP
jgi:hypothetical protein